MGDLVNGQLGPTVVFHAGQECRQEDAYVTIRNQKVIMQSHVWDCYHKQSRVDWQFVQVQFFGVVLHLRFAFDLP